MAGREFGKAWFSMFTDEDFSNQPTGDKWLYMVLLGQPAMNSAGVQPINMRRWRKACRDGHQMPSEAEIEKRLIRMEERRYVFTDDDTGELLVRSFMRRDEIYKQPNPFKSALRSVAHVESPKLASVLLGELDRIPAPTLKSHKLSLEIDDLKAAARTHLEGLTEGLTEPFPKPFAEPFTEGLAEPFARPGKTEPFTEPFDEGLPEGSVVVEVEVNSPTEMVTLGGSRARAREADPGDTHPNRDRIEPTDEKSTQARWTATCRTCRNSMWADASGQTHPSGQCADCRKGRLVDPSADGEPPARCAQHIDDPDPPNCGACANFRKAHERWTERQQRRQAEAQSLKARSAAAARALATANCDLCGDDGYRAGRPCTHDPDEDNRAARGMAMVRAALAKGDDES